MLTFMPTRTVALRLLHQPFADVRLESAHPASATGSSTTIRGSADLEDYPTVIGTAAFPAHPTVSASCKVHSIPIHPPR